jgi:hypothetical protein
MIVSPTRRAARPRHAPRRHAEPRSIAELADRLHRDDAVGPGDVLADIAALGIDDRVARERYGMPAAAVGASVLDHLRSQHRAGRPQVRRRPGYLVAALLRCALYLGPLSVAIAAASALQAVAWPVPAAVLILGWSAAQALTGVGAAVARHQGRPTAARLVGGGFAAVAVLWCALVWIAPAELLGPSRWLAGTVGIGALASLASVTAALVTRAEAAVVRWSLPCWMLAAIGVAGTAGDDWAARVPTETLLPAAITVALVRAYRPVIGRSLPRRPPLNRAVLWRGFGYLLIGAAQASAVVLLWRAGPSSAIRPAALPLLAAVPVLETLVGWHIRQVTTSLDAAKSKRALRRHLRGLTVVTVAVLLPPLAAGAGLAVAAYRLSFAIASRDDVLALAAGTLLSGVFAATFLLAARRRTPIAAALAAFPPSVIAALPLLPGPTPECLPAIVAVFAATHLVGLLAVGLTATDHRRST